MQELVNKSAGIGQIKRNSKGRRKHQEIIDTDKVISFDIDKKINEKFDITSFKIHYENKECTQYQKGENRDVIRNTK